MPTQHTFKQSNPNESTQFGVSHLRTRLNERLDHIFFFGRFAFQPFFFFFLPAPWTVQTNTTHIQTIQSKWIHTIWGITFKNKVKWAFGSPFFFFGRFAFQHFFFLTSAMNSANRQMNSVLVWTVIWKLFFYYFQFSAK